MLNVNEKLMPVTCSCMSLIGVGSKRPTSWGNYFWIDDVRIVNMWWENLEHLKSSLPDGVLVRVYEHDGKKWGLIIDERVPEDFLYQKLCFTGTYRPPKEIGLDMCSVVGNPDNEAEQFTDLKSYYKKRGGDYDEKTGIVKYTMREGKIS